MLPDPSRWREIVAMVCTYERRREQRSSVENEAKEESASLEVGLKDWRELGLLRRMIRLAFCKKCKIHTDFRFHKLLTQSLPCLLTLSKLAESTCWEGGEAKG